MKPGHVHGQVLTLCDIVCLAMDYHPARFPAVVLCDLFAGEFHTLGVIAIAVHRVYAVV